jgi:hypothetical protein
MVGDAKDAAHAVSSTLIMTGKFGLVALVMMFAALTAVGGELAIVSGGRRIIDRDPSASADNCHGWTYGASPVVDDSGNVVAMYTVSDAIANHCKVGIESQGRFGDAIERHVRNDDGTWSSGEKVLDRSSLPWMNDPSFLAKHPESFVGHLSSPSVVRLGGRYYMAFVGSVNDPNLCAAEHPVSGNICGSCREPWSYFVVMWAVSDDGVHWTVRERSPGDATLAGWPPTANDRAQGSNYKGISRVSVVTHVVNGQTYFYIGALYWSPQNMKTLMFRIPYNPADAFGLGGDAEMWSWNRKTWFPCLYGVLPEFINNYNEHSLLITYDPISSIAPTTIRGKPEYIAVASNSSYFYNGYGGRSNRISVQFSPDLIDWTPNQIVRSAVPHFADGYSYDASVIDPIVIEDRGGFRLFLASADGDDGIERDGRHDCDPNAGFGPTAPYVGTGIYEARLEMITPEPTSTNIDIDRSSIVSDETVHCRVEVMGLDGTPVDGMVMIRGDGVTYARLVNGRAEADIRLRGVGQHWVDAVFEEQGLWHGSHSEVNAVQVLKNTHRRAVHR